MVTVLGKWSESGHKLADRLNDVKSMRCGEKGKVVMTFESAYWMEKQARARILYIFSLGASLLAASEQKNISRSAHCETTLPGVSLAGGAVFAPARAISPAASLSFVVAQSHG